MSVVKKYLVPGAGLLALAMVIDLTQANSVMAQAAKDIIIGNSQSQPIPTTVQALPPITGNVTVTNSPAVSLQPGSSVDIGPTNNWVRVGNPVATYGLDDAYRVVAEPAIGMTFPGQAFVNQHACIWMDGVCTGGTVPAGYRLVIDSVSLDIRVPPGQKVLASVYGGGLSHTVPLTLQGTFGTQDIFQGVRTIRLYADAGDQVGAMVHRNSSAGDVTVFATFSGYLVSGQ
jgi:hypothetical protein